APVRPPPRRRGAGRRGAGARRDPRLGPRAERTRGLCAPGRARHARDPCRAGRLGERAHGPPRPPAAGGEAMIGGRILVAPFEPFGGRTINRAERAARLLQGHTIAGHAVEIRSLKTVYASLPGELAHLFAETPDLLLLVGESGLTRHLLVERLAV